MSRSLKLALILPLAVVLLVLIGLGTRSLFCRVKVVVANEGAGPIKNLTINYSGGTESLSELGSGRAYEFSINATGESDLSVSFVDASGSSHSHKVDVYFERNYRGKIDVKIDSASKISSSHQITLCS